MSQGRERSRPSFFASAHRRQRAGLSWRLRAGEHSMKKKTTGSVPQLALALLLVPAAAAAAGHVADKPQRQEALEHYRAGQAHMRAETWAEAEREFKTAIKLDPLLTLAHYGLGQTYMYTRRYPEAVGASTACNDAYMQLAALQLTDSLLADQRRDEEIR